MSEWLEISVGTSALEDAAALLSSELSWASDGVQVQQDCVTFWVPKEEAEKALADTRKFLEDLRAKGFPPTELLFREAKPESEWRDAWKRYFRTLRITRQLIIVPSWDTCEPVEGDLLMHLDPGQAFGTGDHATTRMLLRVLQSLADEDFAADTFLDVGTGSGILSLAAKLLWPSSKGVATDIDPLAVDATTENLDRNGVNDVDVSAKSLSEITGTFPLVLANIQADVLLSMAEDLREKVAPGGHLLLSGLLRGQEKSIDKSFLPLGFQTVKNYFDDRDSDWIAMHLAVH